jgi:hypothetical protein
MIRFVFLIVLVLLILFVLNKRSKIIKNNNTNLYKWLILATIIIGIIFLLATSGKIILPQILQVIKMGLPLVTKFIGI